MFIIWIFFFNPHNKNSDNKKSDIEIIESLMPNLEGIKSVKLYTQQLGTNESRIPGSSTVYVEGVIQISKEISQTYFEENDWELAEIENFMGDLEIPECEWLYSKNFEEKIKSSYYYGKVYFSKVGYVLFYMTVE